MYYRLFCFLSILMLCASYNGRAETSPIHTDISGTVKTLNFFTRTSGFSPENVSNPVIRAEENESVFETMERVRLKTLTRMDLPMNQRLLVQIDYDHQPEFGSFVSTGDYRIARKQYEEAQFLDLSQTLVEKEHVFYQHRLYRAAVTYETEHFDVKVGRQQIPWGVGRFFTPTDIFNPFNPLQLELYEREGVDAANITVKNIRGFKSEWIYTPDGGKDLHPQRYFTRISHDIKGFEVGALGGRIKRDHAVGLDLAGNIKDAAVRGEALYRNANEEKDFMKFTINADYNFPKNIYALLEYHFNGQGKRNPSAYEFLRFLRGDIQQLAKNYLALMLGRDMNDVWKIENRIIWNLDDNSFMIRPDIEYEIRANLFMLLGAQIYGGKKTDELGQAKNIYFAEMRYDF